MPAIVCARDAVVPNANPVMQRARTVLVLLFMLVSGLMVLGLIALFSLGPAG